MIQSNISSVAASYRSLLEPIDLKLVTDYLDIATTMTTILMTKVAANQHCPAITILVTMTRFDDRYKTTRILL